MNFGLIIFCVVAIIMAAFTFLTFSRSSEWKKTRGSIVEARIEEVMRSHSLDRGAGYHSTDYKFIIRYTYAVNGRVYEGDSYLCGLPNVTETRKDAERIVRQYPVKRQVEVYYDPAFEGQSCLFVPKKFSKTAMMTLAVFFIFVIALLFVGVSLVQKKG